jgi:hypothetical protein
LSVLKTAGQITMSRKIVVVNAGPRKGMNTDTIVGEASKGAASTGALHLNMPYTLGLFLCLFF